jgi:hypothetical protein
MSNPYRLMDFPESPGAASRWFVGSTVGGWPGDAGEIFGDAVQALSLAIRGSMKPLAPEPQTFALSQVQKGKDGSYVAAPRGEITRVPVSISERPGAIWQGMNGAGLLDSFLRREIAFEKAPDKEVWKAAAAAAEAMALEGRALRTMNDWLCVALLSRCGVSDVRDSDLPHPFPAPKPKSSNPVVVAREAASHAKG